jgi:TM2 domain-containing membrane protein YozV
MTQQKNKWIAFILAFIGGSLGLHRFYAGKIGSGVTMLVLTLTWVGILISGPWALIDCIRILTGHFKDKDNKDLVE